MKKALSLIMALAMLLTMAVGFNSSAESKNMIAIDEEFVTEIVPDAYICGWDRWENKEDSCASPAPMGPYLPLLTSCFQPE